MTIESLFSKERCHVTQQALQETKTMGHVSQSLGLSAAGGLARRNKSDTRSLDKIISWERKVAPVEPRITTQAGIWSSLSKETASTGKSLQNGGSRWEERKIRSERKCIFSLKDTHIVWDVTLCLAVTCLALKEVFCPQIVGRLHEYKCLTAALGFIFSKLAAVGRIHIYLFIETVVNVFILTRTTLSFLSF